MYRRPFHLIRSVKEEKDKVRGELLQALPVRLLRTYAEMERAEGSLRL
jgi:hypothetical protein